MSERDELTSCLKILDWQNLLFSRKAGIHDFVEFSGCPPSGHDVKLSFSAPYKTC